MSVKHIDFLKITLSKFMAVEIRPIRCLVDTPSGTARTAKWMNLEHWTELRVLLNVIADQYELDKKMMQVTKDVKLNEHQLMEGKLIKIGYMFVPFSRCGCYFLTPRDDATWSDDDGDDDGKLRDKGGKYKGLQPCGEMLVVSVRLQDLNTKRVQTHRSSVRGPRGPMSPLTADKHLMKALDRTFVMTNTISDYFASSQKDSQESVSSSLPQTTTDNSSSSKQTSLKPLAEKSCSKQLKRKRNPVNSVGGDSKIKQRNRRCDIDDSSSQNISDDIDAPVQRSFALNKHLRKTAKSPKKKVTNKPPKKEEMFCPNMPIKKEVSNVNEWIKEDISVSDEFMGTTNQDCDADMSRCEQRYEHCSDKRTDFVSSESDELSGSYDGTNLVYQHHCSQGTEYSEYVYPHSSSQGVEDDQMYQHSSSQGIEDVDQVYQHSSSQGIDDSDFYEPISQRTEGDSDYFSRFSRGLHQSDVEITVNSGSEAISRNACSPILDFEDNDHILQSSACGNLPQSQHCPSSHSNSYKNETASSRTASPIFGRKQKYAGREKRVEQCKTTNSFEPIPSQVAITQVVVAEENSVGCSREDTRVHMQEYDQSLPSLLDDSSLSDQPLPVNIPLKYLHNVSVFPKTRKVCSSMKPMNKVDKSKSNLLADLFGDEVDLGERSKLDVTKQVILSVQNYSLEEYVPKTVASGNKQLDAESSPCSEYNPSPIGCRRSKRLQSYAAPAVNGSKTEIAIPSKSNIKTNKGNMGIEKGLMNKLALHDAQHSYSKETEEEKCEKSTKQGAAEINSVKRSPTEEIDGNACNLIDTQSPQRKLKPSPLKRTPQKRHSPRKVEQGLNATKRQIGIKSCSQESGNREDEIPTKNGRKKQQLSHSIGSEGAFDSNCAGKKMVDCGVTKASSDNKPVLGKSTGRNSQLSQCTRKPSPPKRSLQKKVGVKMRKDQDKSKQQRLGESVISKYTKLGDKHPKQCRKNKVAKGETKKGIDKDNEVSEKQKHVDSQDLDFKREKKKGKNTLLLGKTSIEQTRNVKQPATSPVKRQKCGILGSGKKELSRIVESKRVQEYKKMIRQVEEEIGEPTDFELEYELLKNSLDSVQEHKKATAQSSKNGKRKKKSLKVPLNQPTLKDCMIMKTLKVSNESKVCKEQTKTNKKQGLGGKKLIAGSSSSFTNNSNVDDLEQDHITNQSSDYSSMSEAFSQRMSDLEDSTHSVQEGSRQKVGTEDSMSAIDGHLSGRYGSDDLFTDSNQDDVVQNFSQLVQNLSQLRDEALSPAESEVDQDLSQLSDLSSYPVESDVIGQPSVSDETLREMDFESSVLITGENISSQPSGMDIKRLCIEKIKNISMKELNDRLEAAHDYLSLIMKGKTDCERHKIFIENGRVCKQMFSELVYGSFSEQQIEHVLGYLKSAYLKRLTSAMKDDVRSVQYIWKVLAPSFFIKVVMDNENLCEEKAELLLKEMSLLIPSI